MLPVRRKPILTITVCLTLSLAVQSAQAAQLMVGAATTSITPDKPVALAGQFHVRIARKVDNPVTANALALETRDGDKVLDQAIMISCDLVSIRGTIQDDLRAKLGSRMPGFDLKKLVLNATHTHTAPEMTNGVHVIEGDDVMQPSEYVEFLVNRLADVAVAAWDKRKPGGVSWALGHAVVGHNRRAVYADGTAQMYGKASRPDFLSFEGYEDHGVEILFFWDQDKNLTATAINVACPSQEVEGLSSVNADFWHDVRVALHERYGEDLCVLAWAGAAGDQSPHLQYRKAAEERMRKLRGLSRTQEIARRIVTAVDDVIELAKTEIRTDVPLIHQVIDIELPRRMVTEKEVAETKAAIAAIKAKEKLNSGDQRRIRWHQRALDRYEVQNDDPVYPMELHVIRLGDVAVATNPFELFLDFGIRIKARSKATQTFLIQLAGTSGVYLAPKKAVEGGGYSAVIQSTKVGPEGGQMLVDRTVEVVNGMFE